MFKVQKKYRECDFKSISTGRPLLLSKFALCGSKKSKFMKKPETKGLLSSLGIKTPLSNIPLLVNILF